MTGAKRTILRRERRPTVFSDEALQLFRELDRQPKPDDAAVHRLARLLGLVPQYWTSIARWTNRARPFIRTATKRIPIGSTAGRCAMSCWPAIAAQDKQGRG
jgi:hypothetical protein